MDARTYFLTYVERVGGRKAAAERLSVPYVTIASVCNGHRGIGKRLAERMQIASGGDLDASRLIWIKPDARAA